MWLSPDVTRCTHILSQWRHSLRCIKTTYINKLHSLCCHATHRHNLFMINVFWTLSYYIIEKASRCVCADIYIHRCIHVNTKFPVQQPQEMANIEPRAPAGGQEVVLAARGQWPLVTWRSAVTSLQTICPKRSCCRHPRWDEAEKDDDTYDVLKNLLSLIVIVTLFIVIVVVVVVVVIKPRVTCTVPG